jgi:endonuclease/exonuclease/phosphatase family metal-dependent hydrolase
VADHDKRVVRALTWNLFHGRDKPPNPALFTWGARWLRLTQRDDTFEQVNRSLRREFTQVLGSVPWDIAFLQEAPPRWLRPLARDLGASPASALTSRNFGAPLRRLLALLNPDLIASNEGGSNQLLVRPPWRVAEVRRHVVALEPERRVMLWARLEHPDGHVLCVANLHATTPGKPEGPAQLLAAADRAVTWSDGAPLIFGGDLNQRVSARPELFAELADRFALAPPTPPPAIDHLLARGVEVVDPPHALPDSARRVPASGGRVLQLSDHPYVVASYKVK